MASVFQTASVATVLDGVDTAIDPRSALQRVREFRVAAEASGEKIPEAISTLERQLTQECIAESQGR
jgi:hypothetical protein